MGAGPAAQRATGADGQGGWPHSQDAGAGFLLQSRRLLERGRAAQGSTSPGRASKTAAARRDQQARLDPGRGAEDEAASASRRGGASRGAVAEVPPGG